VNRERKILTFTIIISLFSIYFIVARYEKLIADQDKVIGEARKRKYTSNELIAMIKKSSEYIGDSIYFSNDGKNLLSSNAKFQGTLEAVVGSHANMDLVYNEMASTNKPKLYCTYIIAARYYRDQYKEEFKKITN